MEGVGGAVGVGAACEQDGSGEAGGCQATQRGPPWCWPFGGSSGVLPASLMVFGGCLWDPDWGIGRNSRVAILVGGAAGCAELGLVAG